MTTATQAERISSFWIAIVSLLALLAAASASGETFNGVATCAGSTCHGRAEGNGAVVRQDEIATWQEPSSPSGAHSRAYAVLNSLRGRQIAASLGIKAASASGQCLGCHATPTKDGTRGARFQLSDGVGCEACHGSSAGWLASHYSVGGSHAANVAAGMTPLELPRARAQVCLDCHYAGPGAGQFVSHKLMAAGHPRMSFELDLFSALQQHHDTDADYARRKGDPGSVRLWAVGQAEAVRRQMEVFRNPQRASQGLFPEFYFFDCHSCHRAIADGPQRTATFEPNPGRPIPFATPPFNDENMIMLSAVTRVLAPASAAPFDSATKEFHRAMGVGHSETVAAAAKLETAADALARALDKRAYGGDDAYRVVAAIADRTTSSRFTDFAGSVQAVMATDTLLNALVKEGRVTVGAAAGIRASINRAYGAVESPQNYNPASFRAALGQAARSIEALQ